jgi:hypothetical protein
MVLQIVARHQPVNGEKPHPGTANKIARMSRRYIMTTRSTPEWLPAALSLWSVWLESRGAIPGARATAAGGFAGLHKILPATASLLLHLTGSSPQADQKLPKSGATLRTKEPILEEIER